MDYPKLCSVAGCGKPANGSRGMCSMRHTRISTLTKIKWISDHSSHDGDECLIWPFSRIPNGYGQLPIDGKLTGAHREMCRQKYGEPPTPEHEAAHSCGKGHDGCVNPKHLRWATGSQNQFERADHGTDSRGEKCGTHKLKEHQVSYIKSVKGSVSQSVLASQFGVSHHTISDIFRGKTWSWLK